MNNYINRFGDTVIKPNYHMQWNVGDVIVLDNGQNALITGYGVYDGQYWVEKYYGDKTVHLAGGNYEFSNENTEAVKNRVTHIVRIETDMSRKKEVINAYIKAMQEWIIFEKKCFKNKYEDLLNTIQNSHIEYFKNMN